MLFLSALVLRALASYWNRVALALLICAAVYAGYQWVEGRQRPDTIEPSSSYGSVGSSQTATSTVAVSDGRARVYEDLGASRLETPRPDGAILYRSEFVIDGDTLYTPSRERIRLYGIDAPEVGSRCYLEATWELRRAVANGFFVERGERARDRHGRSLYYLFTPDGESIDLHMVASGLARAFDGDGQHRAVLVEAEQLAQQHRVGCLWGG